MMNASPTSLLKRIIALVAATATIGLICGCSLILAPRDGGADGSVTDSDGDADYDNDNDNDNDRDGDCQPRCEGRECGSDGCGGWCRPGCLEGFRCRDGLCECEPSCTGRDCGPDGCGGLCPPGCPETQECNVSGRCECIDCAELPCGGPDGCGGICRVSCPGICCDGVCHEDGECCTDAQCGGCLGDGTRCVDLNTAEACRGQDGCTWGAVCVRTDPPTWCSQISQNRCTNCNCRWSGWIGVCYSPDIGNPQECSGLDAAACVSCGCALSASCSGEASNCELYSRQELCLSQTGCRWRGCEEHLCVESFE